MIEVHKRQKQLVEAEREVARREAAVLELEAMIEKRIAELEADRAAIEARIATWETQDGDRIKKLAKVYSAMPPARAAVLLSELELNLAVSVLAGMKQKNSAKVLAVIDSKRALVLSRRLARPLRPLAPFVRVEVAQICPTASHKSGPAKRSIAGGDKWSRTVSEQSGHGRLVKPLRVARDLRHRALAARRALS